MSNELGILKVKSSYETISKKLTEQTWINSQDSDLVEALRNTQDIIGQLSTTIYVMSDYLEQYTQAIRSLPLFNDIESASPTQTPPTRDPRVEGNRATRRANKKT